MTASHRLAQQAVVALLAVGVRHVVLCPGSRSAPLAYALDAAERSGTLTLHVRHDERVAAFTALGLTTAGAPAAVATTSGTAVANLHPAVLEAHHAALPLVVVTADRPRRLRGTWANQTTELQATLFGAAVRAGVDLDADADSDGGGGRDEWSDRLRGGLAALNSGRPGPVHLNLGFAEPLVPDGPIAGDLAQDAVEPLSPIVSQVVTTAAGGSSRRDPDPPLRLGPGPRTVIVAGATTGRATGAAAWQLAAATGWPLLAEPSSAARGADAVPGPYRLLLEHAELGGLIDRVVVFGRPTLSRPVTRLLARPDVDLVLVSPWPDWPDPGRPATRGVSVDAPVADLETEQWARGWHRCGHAAHRALDAVLDAHPELSGPAVARAVAAALRDGESLVVAASNPIRDLDLVAGPVSDRARVLANRGLSGIDGTLSTATGHALSTARPTRVLIGDLAALHDLNALLLPPTEHRPDRLQVVVVNDQGGGIFSLLEYGELAERDDAQAERFERLFGTPHHADLAALCRGFGVPHRRAGTAQALASVLDRPEPGLSLVEVPISRRGLRGLHAQIRTAVAAAVTAVL